MIDDGADTTSRWPAPPAGFGDHLDGGIATIQVQEGRTWPPTSAPTPWLAPWCQRHSSASHSLTCGLSARGDWEGVFLVNGNNPAITKFEYVTIEYAGENRFGVTWDANLPGQPAPR